MKNRIIAVIIALVLLVGIIIIVTNDQSKEVGIKKTYREITDKKTIKEINKKVNYISSRNGKLFSGGIIETFYFNDSFLNKLNDDDKAYIVLDSLVSDNKLKKCINLDIVNKRYNYLFGEDIPNEININNRDSINYNINKKGKYCIISNNKYDLKGYMYMYINKIVSNGNYIKAYVNFGMSGDVVSTDKWIVYDSLDNSIYKAGFSLEEVQDFRIDENNYSEFIEYQFVFKKKNNNFYFVKIEENGDE